MKLENKRSGKALEMTRSSIFLHERMKNASLPWSDWGKSGIIPTTKQAEGRNLL